jgi:hypothetical protein
MSGPAGISAERAAAFIGGGSVDPVLQGRGGSPPSAPIDTDRGAVARDEVGGLLEHLIGIEQCRIDRYGVGSRR